MSVQKVRRPLFLMEDSTGPGSSGGGGSSGSDKVFYGVCSTAANTPIKIVTVQDPNFVVSVGVFVGVYFGTANSASYPQLNVNGTGSFPVMIGYKNIGGMAGQYHPKVISSVSDTTLLLFQYDGQYWQLLNPNIKAFLIDDLVRAWARVNVTSSTATLMSKKEFTAVARSGIGTGTLTLSPSPFRSTSAMVPIGTVLSASGGFVSFSINSITSIAWAVFSATGTPADLPFAVTVCGLIED